MEPKEQPKPVEQTSMFPEAPGKKEAKRNCDECGREYTFYRDSSRFCSDRCYRKHLKHNVPAETVSKLKVNGKEKSTEPPQVISAQLGHVPPHMQIAIDLLKQSEKYWKDRYEEERSELKKVKDQLAQAEKQAKDREYQQTLQGLEQKKPDLIDRLAALPPHVTEMFAPLVGRLGNLLVPEGAAGSVAGVAGQLDEVQVQILTWLSQLPEAQQKELLALIASMMSMNQEKLTFTLNRIKTLFTNGNSADTLPGGFHQFMSGN